jgi:hypothetical protein
MVLNLNYLKDKSRRIFFEFSNIDRHLCYIDLENIGTKPINSIDIVLHENQIKFPENPYLIYELAEEPEVFTWNKEELLKKLPLLPGQRTQLPINIYGKITT